MPPVVSKKCLGQSLNMAARIYQKIAVSAFVSSNIFYFKLFTILVQRCRSVDTNGPWGGAFGPAKHRYTRKLVVIAECKNYWLLKQKSENELVSNNTNKLTGAQRNKLTRAQRNKLTRTKNNFISRRKSQTISKCSDSSHSFRSVSNLNTPTKRFVDKIGVAGGSIITISFILTLARSSFFGK